MFKEAGIDNKIQTGFPDLDEVLDGGFEKGQLYVIAGAGAMGKSALVQNIAWQASQNQDAVMYCSYLEELEVLFRICKYKRHLPDYYKMSREQWLQAYEIMQDIVRYPLYIKNLEGLIRTGGSDICSEYVRNHDCALLIIDDFELMVKRLHDHGKNKSVKMTYIKTLERLSRIADENSTAVIIVMGLEDSYRKRLRYVPKRKDILKWDLIKRFVQKSLILYREDFYFSDSQRKRIAEIAVRKNRRIEMVWLSEYLQYANICHSK